MDIKYSAVLKNRHRPSAKYWGRIRQGGKEKWVNLETQDRAAANRWVERQRNVLFQVNELLERGEEVPAELMSRLLTADTPAIARKRPSGPVSTPGGVVDRWQVFLKAQGFRQTTIDTYTRCIRAVLKETPVESLTADRVVDLFVAKSKLADSTRKFMSNALRNLFGFLGRGDLADAVPKVRVDEEGERTWFTPEQMMDLWMAARSGTAAATEQYRLYFRLLVETAARNTEARLLKWKDIQEDATVRFSATTTKTRRARTVPISWELYGELDIIRRGPEEEVFNLVSRNQTRRYKVFKRALRSIGLEKGTLHDLRRSRAMEIYRKTGDIRIASRWLGDSEIIAMKHYLEDVSVEELRESVLDGE